MDGITTAYTVRTPTETVNADKRVTRSLGEPRTVYGSPLHVLSDVAAVRLGLTGAEQAAELVTGLGADVADGDVLTDPRYPDRAWRVRVRETPVCLLLSLRRDTP